VCPRCPTRQRDFVEAVAAGLADGDPALASPSSAPPATPPRPSAARPISPRITLTGRISRVLARRLVPAVRDGLSS
jgi:hypothetical protein